MQQAIPFKSWPLPCATTANASRLNNHVMNRAAGSKNDMLNMVAENAVIVVARKGCCMSHVMRRLLLALGVYPAVYEIEEEDEVGVLNELEQMICKDNKNNSKDKKLLLPAVFIGGRLFGGLDKVIATHISGDLVPVLKDAGALWL